MTAPASFPAGALAGIRVLDLSGPMGNYCGKLFADMGADVILVEPPEGTALRREGPFVDDQVTIETSLPFAYANTSKRGITLDLDRSEGRELLLKLAGSADLLIETEKPGVMDRRGLGYADLSAARPSLVYTSITAFGQTGPYADYEAEDIVGLALGGLLYLAGYPDREPIAAYGNQAYAAASLFGAVASMMAVLSAEASGEGEHIDVSMQEAVVMGLENAAQFYDMEGVVRKRYAGGQRQAGAGVFRCADGDIYMLAGGIASNRFWKNSIDWLNDERLPGAEKLKDERWMDSKYLATAEAKETFAAMFEPYAATKTKSELTEIGRVRRIPIAPVATPADILASRQLKHREFFQTVGAALAGREIVMPGAPYKLSGTPWRISRPAPRLGEHNAEIFGALGLSVDDQSALLRARVI